MNPAFIPQKQVAKWLGISATMFHEKKPALEAEGFPKPDPLLKRYLRDDVEAWLKGRRKIADPDTVTTQGPPAEINWDAL